MKTLKRFFLAGLATTLVVMLAVTAHAARKTSAYGYLGNYAYWASAEYVGSSFVSGSSGLHTNGGSDGKVTVENNYGDHVYVGGNVYLPSNYGTYVTRTVYK